MQFEESEVEPDLMVRAPMPPTARGWRDAPTPSSSSRFFPTPHAGVIWARSASCIWTPESLGTG